MRERPSMWPALWHLTTLGAAAVVWGCQSQVVLSTATWPSARARAITECPMNGMWSPIFRDFRLPGLPPSGRLHLADWNTDVPEFNDCQAFIAEDGTGNANGRNFRALFAIFARHDLREASTQFDSIKPRDSLRTASDTSRARTAQNQVAVGEVLALKDPYPDLGLDVGFNCLVLWGDITQPSGLSAKMIPVGSDESKCKDDNYLMTATGTRLYVHRTPYPVGSVPFVSRWDWDSKNHIQSIGIACGDGWCDIGKTEDFVPSTPHMASIVNAGDQIHAVKGWYDEQRLAFPDPAGGPLSVGTVIGSIMPAPELATDVGNDPTHSRYYNSFAVVATAAVEYEAGGVYKKKLNMEPTPPVPSTVIVSLCYGDRANCIPADRKPKCTSTGAAWWARVTASASGDTHYFCVARMDHAGITIPPVARWRWALHDETMWIRCLEGCCEVEANSIDALAT